MIDLAGIWSEIDDEPGEDGEIRRLLDPSSPYDVYAMQTRPRREYGFLARFDEHPGTLWRSLRNSRGMDIRADARPGVPASIRLVERDPRFHSVFEALVQDLLKGLEVIGALPVSTRPLAMDFVAGRIGRWQTCLKAHDDGLSRERRTGLVGELLTLEHLVAAGVPTGAAVTGWSGPDWGVQDFQYGGHAVEVKTSRQALPSEVRISSERQLDTSNVNRLFLVHYGLDERDDGVGRTLPTLVEFVRDAVGRKSDAALLLDDRLIDYGYLDVHAPRYAATAYEVRTTEVFEVTDGFPRITESDLMMGIGGVQYDLSLSACQDFQTDSAALWSLIREETR